MNLSVYIHIPFCRSKCNYCDFYSIADCSSSDNFVDSLLSEIDTYAGDPRFNGKAISSIFFGGGTPSVIPPGRVAQIIDRLLGHFDIENNAEITLEANPDDITGANVRKYLGANINRISIGAQSFDDMDLHMLARRHDAAGVLNAVREIRDAGLDNISLDLIYGIPDQTLEGWQQNIEMALALSPKHISAYCLTLESGTQLHTAVREGLVVLPSEETLRGMYLEAIRSFEQAGLMHYELSNFAIPGYESRHNLAYWTGKPYLGFGPAASSYLPPRRWTNVADLDRYAEMIRDTGRAVNYDENLGDDLLRLEYIMLSLRLKRGLSVSEYAAMFGKDIEREYGDKIQMLLDADLMVRSDGFLRLTPEGMFMSDAIITNLA